MKLPKPPVTIESKYIKKIHYSGLRGRIAHFPAKKGGKETFVIVPGHHSSHERMASFAWYLTQFGDVYMIDVPGFGGMNSFHSIGKEVTYDNYAEYMYTVLKTQKITKNVSFFAVSLGGQYVTRMLQKYPDSQQWTKRVIGFVTFGAGKDFHLSLSYKILIMPLVWLGSSRLGAGLTKLLVFNRYSLKVMLQVFARLKKKMRTNDPELRKQFIDMEYYLWLANDKRTQTHTAKLMFNDDLRTYSEQLIDVPMHNIMTQNDQYVDHKETNKTMRDLYRTYKPHYLTMKVHSPSLIADESEVEKTIDRAIILDILGLKK